MKLQPARGTQDFLPEQAEKIRQIEQKAHRWAALYGYKEIVTPIFEFTEVFHRTMGETSDVIHKETYTFNDRGGESLTLRPEGTAGIARAFISEGLAQNLPLKFYYSGPMFRYERPQKGRYRQFHQIGVECLGYESPRADVECLALAWNLIKELGLSENCHLEINTLGDKKSRENYRQKLVEFLTPMKDRLSTDSQMRLEKNPLRILDSKDAGDRELLKNCPQLQSELSPESLKFYDDVKAGLKTLGIPFKENQQLVRGLDYYCHSVFEFVTTQLGAQGTILAGGRYDGLIESMGGPSTPGVGWAAGMERLAELAGEKLKAQPKILIAIAPADESGENESLKVAELLREKNLTVEILWNGNVGKKMKKANSIGATHAIIIGSNEVSQQSVTVKNLSTSEQKIIATKDLGNLGPVLFTSG